MTRVPGVARRLLTALLPAGDRDAVLGDLEEEFRQEAASRGARRARAWYWRQAAGSVPHLVRMRWRARRHQPVQPQTRRSLAAAIAQDVRLAVRGYRTRAAVSAAAVLTGGIGIAVVTAVFGVVDAVLIRPLPYADPASLLHLVEGRASRPAGGGQLSYPDFVDLVGWTRTLEVAGYSGGSRTLATQDGPERVVTGEATAGFFDVLGIAPALGRTFRPADSVSGAARVVVLTHRAWQRRFAADRSAIGRSITLNGTAHTVVGVLPAAFEFPLRGRAEMWLPLLPSAAQAERRYFHWLDVIARRRADATDAQVRGDLTAIAARWGGLDAGRHGDTTLDVVPLRDRITGGIRPALLALAGGAVLMLVATCVTIGGLAAAAAADRGRELAIYAALGAGPVRVGWQVFLDSLLLALTGGAIGAAAAFSLVRAFLASLPPLQRTALPHLGEWAPDVRTAVFALLLSLAVGALAGIVPAIRAARRTTGETLRAVGGSRTFDAGRSRTALVLAQVSIAVMLLSGTALLGRSLYRLVHASPGFDVRGKLTFRVSLPGARYASAPLVQQFHGLLLERLEAVPGVRGAATIDQLPLMGQGNTGTFVTDLSEAPEAADLSACIRTVSPNYFQVMGVPLLRGRAFNRADRAGGHVVLINRTLAERVFRHADPLGRRIAFQFFPGQPRWEIVGVVGDEQFGRLDRDPLPVVYFPFSQNTAGAFSAVVATDQVDGVALGVRQAVRALDPEVPVFDVQTMERIAAESDAFFARLQVLRLFGLFGATALLLAGMGLYAVLSHAVARQRREIGVRIALGATRGQVLRMILARGLRPAAGGVAAGLALAASAGAVLDALLFEIAARDPASLAAVASVVLGMALLVSLVPALRALRIDPATALRAE